MSNDASVQGLKQGSFRPDIEGLRGIAILLVVAYHAGILGFSGGFIGVDIFFALSGYLITGLLVKEGQKTGRIGLMNFYARRIRRLLPASSFMLLCTVLVGMVLFPPLAQSLHWKAAAATAAYCSNILFMHQRMDYFAPANYTNPLMHTWSLAVEEQFYLVWPALFVIALRSKNFLRFLTIQLVAVSAISLAAGVWLTYIRQPWAFFLSPARAWEFGLGGLASLLPADFLQRQRKYVGILGWAGLGAILFATLRFSATTTFPGAAALIPVVGTIAALLPGAVPGNTGVGMLLGRGFLQGVGKLSYSWYLWHWPVLMWATAVDPEISVAGRLLCAAGSYGIAALTYVLVEKPVRYNSFLVQRPMQSLAAGALIGMVGLGSALGWHRSIRAAAERPPQKAIFKAAKDLPALEGCISDFADARVHECNFGDSGASTDVVLFGDSHAAQWFPALQRVAIEHKFRLTTMLKSSCPTARVSVFNPHLERVEVECSRWRETALLRIAAINPAAVVISHSSMSYVIVPGQNQTGYATSSLEQWRDGTRSTLAEIDSAGIQTLFIRDTPRPGFDVPMCLSRAAHPTLYFGEELSCSLLSDKVLDQPLYRAEEEAASGLRHVQFADLSAEFCGPESCDPIKDGTVVYRDGNHMTATFALRLAPVVAHRLLPLLGSMPPFHTSSVRN
ncbi:MAG: acyltransferase family protein [Terriglobia bacterium]